MRIDSNRPPWPARWLLRLCLHEVEADHVNGDLEETYFYLRKCYGRHAAGRWYWSQVVRSIPTFLSRTIYWSCVMLQNYIKIAFRTVIKNKGYAIINVLGLALGIAICTLIFLYIKDEWTFDQFHENEDRIYRVLFQDYYPDGSVKDVYWNMPMPAGPALLEDIPEVTHTVRFGEERHYIRNQDNAILEDVLYADASIFDVFTFPLLLGDPATALNDLNTVVLSRDAARKYYADDDPLGKALDIRVGDYYEVFTVTGVAENVPSNSTIQFDILLPFPKLPTTEAYREYDGQWNYISFEVYALLNEKTTEEGLQAKLDGFFDKYYPDQERQMREEGEWSSEGRPRTFSVEPIADIHLKHVSDPKYSLILSGIALAILLIACINFMTLAIGRSASRSGEVGIRKVVGAHRKQLVGQFWGEALLMSVLALLVGILLALWFLPLFNDLAGKQIRFDFQESWVTLAAMVGLVLLTGLVAGSYPAVVLSGFKTIDVLKGRLTLSGSNVFTKSLVVIQFSLSVFLIISTIIMSRQLDYIQNIKLGFDKDHLLVIQTSGIDAREVAKRFRDRLGSHQQILGITAAGSPLGYSGVRGTRFFYEGEYRYINMNSVDADYLDVIGIELAEGHSFNSGRVSDSSHSVLVNEALVRDFNIVDPIGKTVPGDRFDELTTIIGVVKDYNFQVLYQEVGAMMLTLNDLWGMEYVFIRIRPERIPETVELLHAAWDELSTGMPLPYRFLDDELQARYQSDQRWSRIVTSASILAILVACLGLFGLIALSVAARWKEIGIRKVMGASVRSVVFLLSKDYLLLVLLGVLLASPVAFFAMQRWLENFAYRVPIEAGLFVLTTILVLLLAFITLSYQTVKAAVKNPVDSIRYE